MAFVGPHRGSGGGLRWARTAASLLAATVLVVGALGEGLRWLGGVALSEVVACRALCWWWPALGGQPWIRLGLRLAAAVVLLGLVDITMPDAAAVGTIFLLGGLASLFWLGLARLVGVGVEGERLLISVVPPVAVGLWFSVLGVPGSGWSAMTALLVAATALEARRVVDGASPQAEQA